MTRTCLLLAALAGCSVTEAKSADDVSIELASVTLADDCGMRAPPTNVKPPTGGNFAKPPANRKPQPPGAAAPARRACEQTSMQLAIRTRAKKTTIRVKKVELLDTKGKLLEVLVVRAPMQWKDDGYVEWDQTLGPNASVAAMYDLGTPNWDKLTGGRWQAHSKTFQLRVTVTVGSADRTVEKQAITPARLPAAVPT